MEKKSFPNFHLTKGAMVRFPKRLEKAVGNQPELASIEKMSFGCAGWNSSNFVVLITLKQ